MDDPQAPADAGGQTSASALRTESALEKSDEELRRLAVARLAEHLDIGSSLVARCEELAHASRGDRLGPLHAAARLMRANALVAQALANVAQVERRRRTIVEHIQPPGFKFADLNSTLENRLAAALRLKLLGYMTLVADETFNAALDEIPDDAVDTPEKETAAPAFRAGPDAL